MGQASRDATAPRPSFSLSDRTKKRLVAGAIAVAIIVIVASILGYLYYYQPVRGAGSVSTTTIDVGQSVQFGFTPSQGISPYRYSWNFGDGSVSSEKSPLHSYSSPGTYLSTITARDTAGKATTWTTTITVNPLPSVVGTVSPSVGAGSMIASFTAHGQGGTPNFKYSWHFGDGTSSEIQNPTHHYSTGTYTATVVATDGAGMSATWSVSITINLPLIMGFTNRYAGSPGLTMLFTCTPSQGVPPYSYYWQFGDGQSSTLQNPSHAYVVMGTYHATLNVTDSIGETVEGQMTIILN
jgi:PKD repeat protein